MRLFADFVFHFQLFVAKPREHLFRALALAHLHAKVQRCIVVDVPWQVVGFVGQQHFDDVLAVLLAGLVQWGLARFVPAFQVAVAAQQHRGYLVLAHFAREVQGCHLVGAQRVHIRHQVALQAAVEQLTHLGHVVQLHLPDQFVIALFLYILPLPPVFTFAVSHIACCFIS